VSGIERIAAERARQIEQESWSSDHDDQHTDKSLALAAALYATPMPLYAVEGKMSSFRTYDPWPWERKTELGHHTGLSAWDKRDKHSYERRLEIAGALIAAELDRLERVKIKSSNRSCV
jgi:hypothetical protein